MNQGLAEALAMPDEEYDPIRKHLIDNERAYRRGYVHGFKAAMELSRVMDCDAMLRLAEQMQAWRDAMRLNEDTPNA